MIAILSIHTRGKRVFRTEGSFLKHIIDSGISRSYQTSLLNHPKHVTHVLHHDPSDVSYGVNVMLGVVEQAGACDEVEIFEDSVEAFGDARMEIL